MNKDKARTFPSSANFNGEHLKNPNEIAEAFNDHCATKALKLANKIRSKATDDHLQYLSVDSSSTVPLGEHLLKREGNKLTSSKSGHDKIPVKVIKGTIVLLAKQLAAISILPWKRVSSRRPGN